MKTNRVKLVELKPIPHSNPLELTSYDLIINDKTICSHKVENPKKVTHWAYISFGDVHYCYVIGGPNLERDLLKCESLIDERNKE